MTKRLKNPNLETTSGVPLPKAIFPSLSTVVGKSKEGGAAKAPPSRCVLQGCPWPRTLSCLLCCWSETDVTSCVRYVCIPADHQHIAVDPCLAGINLSYHGRPSKGDTETPDLLLFRARRARIPIKTLLLLSTSDGTGALYTEKKETRAECVQQFWAEHERRSLDRWYLARL